MIVTEAEVDGFAQLIQKSKITADPILKCGILLLLIYDGTRTCFCPTVLMRSESRRWKKYFLERCSADLVTISNSVPSWSSSTVLSADRSLQGFGMVSTQRHCLTGPF